MLAQTPERAGAVHRIRALDRPDLPGCPPVRYLDTGEAGFRPVVFFGGLGTSAGAFSLTEFAAHDRRRLALRFVSVERNGFGGTPFMPGLGFPETIDDVLLVLDSLGIGRFSVVAISGGGPYAARLLERAPGRILSVHLAAAATGGELLRRGAAGELLDDVGSIATDPEGFWEQPADSPVQEIPGFAEACREEGRRALGDPTRASAALRHEIELLRSEPLPDLVTLEAPAYLYWGGRDELIGSEDAAAWQDALGPNVIVRLHEDLGHDVQYVRWPDILADIAREAEA